MKNSNRTVEKFMGVVKPLTAYQTSCMLTHFSPGVSYGTASKKYLAEEWVGANGLSSKLASVTYGDLKKYVDDLVTKKQKEEERLYSSILPKIEALAALSDLDIGESVVLEDCCPEDIKFIKAITAYVGIDMDSELVDIPTRKNGYYKIYVRSQLLGGVIILRVSFKDYKVLVTGNYICRNRKDHEKTRKTFTKGNVFQKYNSFELFWTEVMEMALGHPENKSIVEKAKHGMVVKVKKKIESLLDQKTTYKLEIRLAKFDFFGLGENREIEHLFNVDFVSAGLSFTSQFIVDNLGNPIRCDRFFIRQVSPESTKNLLASLANLTKLS